MTIREQLIEKRNRLRLDRDIFFRDYTAKSQYFGGQISGLEDAIDLLKEEEVKKG